MAASVAAEPTTAVDAELAALFALAADSDPLWRHTVAGLRRYKGLRPADRVARCGGCRGWVINPADHGGRSANSVPRPWAAKAAGCQPTCAACVARAKPAGGGAG